MDKYLRGNANPEEERLLEEWYKDEVDNDITIELQAIQHEETEEDLKQRILKKVYGVIEERSPKRKTVYLKWLKYSGAAVLLIAIGIYTAWFTASRQSEKTASAVASYDIAAPDRSRASLTLDDGTIISLDEKGSGEIARQNTTAIMKTNNGGIVYNGHFSANTELYNTLSNPRGSQAISMTLSDGTKVWLNTGSTLRYPVFFNTKERIVEINGEGYFEVAPDKKKPFYVKKANADANIAVLGTHFNVNAYDDEPVIKVSLFEGKVRVEKSKKAVTLLPGQEALLKKDGTVSSQSIIDADAVLAWKNGLFNFDGATLKEVVRQLERWYDIEAVYEGNVPTIELEGNMTKDISLNGLLRGLENLGVRSRMSGRKLIILP